MPRPKRSKVAPSAPIALPHLAKLGVASAAQKQKVIFSPASSGRVTTTSDDSDGLVVSKKTAARAKGSEGHEYTMSGALAPEDIGSTRLKPPSKQTRAALSKIAREADYAKKVAEAKHDAGQVETTVEPDQIPSSIPTEPVSALKPSLNGMNTSPVLKNAQIGLGSKISETPRPQLSMLGATFKKRARQPSLLQMLQTQNEPSENLDDGDGLDDFRPDDESTPMIKSMLQPNAQHVPSSPHPTTGSRKRKLATPEIQIPASQSPEPPSSPPSAPPQEPEDVYDLPAEEAERPEPALPKSRFSLKPHQQIDSDTLAPPRSSSSCPETQKARQVHNKKSTKAAGSTRPQQTTRRKGKAIPPPARPPLSSTKPSPVKPVKPPPKPRPLATATLQNLLPRRRARPTTRGEYDVPNSSSDLDLELELELELDGTALGEDEDELSFHAATKMRRKTKAKTMKNTKMKTKKKGQVLVGRKRGAVAAGAAGGGKGRAKAKEAPVNDSGKVGVSRTYTKKTTFVSSDNENENENENASLDEDEDGVGNDDNVNGAKATSKSKTKGRKKTPTSALLDSKATNEMKRLADKFREVDAYALDFEDMDMTGNSSGTLMRDAR